ncbi:hypothetical protein CDD81_2802 [Ophiocordyceps australis]|uniref:nitric oxide dioxygenase n=1 Tax=Ophiocordyceps australis TaxID=1399860 RepID=A0A2C5XY61_9HYPO|nr:hypothetical protein CDD81_2802 [Ophiocordyceps australis]
MALSAQQIAIVKSTAPVIKEHGKTITTYFYKTLLDEHPELKNIFSLRHQQVGAQQQALADAVFGYAAYIDDLGKLTEAVERIAQKHVSLLVRPEHYPIVGDYLVRAFGHVLGPALTPDIKEAWVAAYGQLANVFIAREKELYGRPGTWTDWRRFVISRREQEAEGIVSLYLRPVDGKPLVSYQPGQYVSVQVPLPELDGLRQNRQFSLSTAPADATAEYRISVKREDTVASPSVDDVAEGKIPGLISNMLHDEYPIGHELSVSAPAGEFFYDADAAPATDPIVLLSLGVGATPHVAILDAVLQSRHARRPISWIQAARSSAAMCFRQHVRAAAAAHDNVRPLLWVKEVREGDTKGNEYDVEGRLDMDAVLQRDASLLHLDNGAAGYYLCGPQEWMVQTRRWLEQQGVPRTRIHLELFGTGEAEPIV